MTQEDKELLLKDLCARLSYGVIAHALEINKVGTVTDINLSYNTVNLTVDNASGDYDLVPISDIKPYLRSMSSMTEEELKMFKQLQVEADEAGTFEGDMLLYDWLNKNHFDYRLLIFQGLALEAPKDMYKNK